MNKVSFWTDGAYSSSKKHGGWAFYCPQYRLKVCHQEWNTTNNRMELLAAIKALEFVIDSALPEKEIVIYSDSKYLVETMSGNYSKKTNLDLWTQLDDLVHELFNKQIKFIHVKGHTGEANENDIADKLANLVSQM